MTTDAVELDVQRTAARWAFIQSVLTPDQHDFSPEGQRAVSLDEFLRETQQVLQDKGLL